MKNIVKIISLIAILVSVFLLASCDLPLDTTPDSADELLASSSIMMMRSKSYRADGEIKVTLFPEGEKYTAEGTVTVIETPSAKNYYYYSHLKMDAKHQTSPAVVTEQKNIFYDGIAYVYTKQSGDEQKICSASTKERFIEIFRENNTSFDDEALLNCSNKTIEQTESGWLATYSGYGENLDPVLKFLGIDAVLAGAEAKDLVLTFSATEELYLSEVKFSVVFEEPEEESRRIPQVEFVFKYSEYDNVTLITDDISEKGIYTAVTDVCLLKEFETALNNVSKKESGSFTLDVKQTLSIEGMSEQSSKEHDDISFRETENGYYYNIDADVNGTSVKITYAKQKQTVKSGANTNTVTQTDSVARAYIKSLMNSAQYDIHYVKSITEKDDGTYVIEVRIPDKSAYRTIVSQMGLNYLGVEKTITFTMKDGEIAKIESNIIIECTYGSGSSEKDGTFTINSVAEFPEEDS